MLPEVVGMGGVQPDAPPADLLPGVLAGLRARNFELAVQLHGGGAQSHPVVRDFGARRAIGLQAPDAELLDSCVPYRYYQPEVARCLEVVALAGAAPPGADAHIAVTAADLAEAAAAVPEGERPLVALHPGATDNRRRRCHPPPDCSRFWSASPAAASEQLSPCSRWCSVFRPWRATSSNRW